MMANDMWSLLGIEPTQDKKAIRRAFAEQTRLHHPEEEPELFARLNEAYKNALEYAKSGVTSGNILRTENEETWGYSKTEQKEKSDSKSVSLYDQFMREENKAEDTEAAEDTETAKDIKAAEDTSAGEEPDMQETAFEKASLLEIMEEAEKEKIRKSLQSGALRSFVELFENPDKVKLQETWKKYFISDEFLAEQFQEEFGKGMLGYIESQTLYPVDNLPTFFLLELAIAYGFEPYIAHSEYRISEQRHVELYRVETDSSILARQYVAEIWNKQGANCSFRQIMSLLNKPENKCRHASVLSYLKLKSMNQKGSLTRDYGRIWQEIIWCGDARNLYERFKNEKTGQERHSICFIKLLIQWLKDENVPQPVLESMYQTYQLKSIEHSSTKTLYAPLKAEIDKQITIEEQESIEDRQEMIKTWYNTCYKISDAFYNVGADRYGETEEIRERVKKLFEMPEWEKIKYEPALFEKLKYVYGSVRTPISLAEKLIAHFSSENYPQTELVHWAIEELYTSISFQHMMQEKNPDKPADHPFYRNKIVDINASNLYFWQYFFLYAYGYRSAVVVTELDLAYALGSSHYLPAYIQHMYRMTGEWQKVFTGFDEEENCIKRPLSISYQMEDGRTLRIEFHLHYILFFLDEVQVLRPQLTFEQLEKYQKKLEKPEHFFYLLAITAIEERTRTAAEKLIGNWLEKLPFYPIMRPMLAKMLAADNDRLPKEREVQALYYVEQKRFCFRMVVYEQEVLLQRQVNYQRLDKDFLKKDFGWKKIPLSEREQLQTGQLDLEGKKQFAQQKLQTLLQPKPVVDKHYSFDGMSWEEKAAQIFQVLEGPESYCILHYKNHLVGDFDRLFYFAKYPFGINLQLYSERYVTRLAFEQSELQRKAKQRSEIWGYFGWGKSDKSPDLVILGENGTYYADANDSIKTLREKSLPDLFRKQYEKEMKDVVSMTTYKGLLTVSRLDHELEYCYTEKDLAESAYSEEETIADFFTVFGKYPTWVEFAAWMDRALEHGLPEETKVIRFCYEELNARDCALQLQALNYDEGSMQKEQIIYTIPQPRFVWKNLTYADEVGKELQMALNWYQEYGKFAEQLGEEIKILFCNYSVSS